MHDVYSAQSKPNLNCSPDDPIWRVPIVREHELVPAKEFLHFTPTAVEVRPIPTEPDLRRLVSSQMDQAHTRLILTHDCRHGVLLCAGAASNNALSISVRCGQRDAFQIVPNCSNCAVQQ